MLNKDAVFNSKNVSRNPVHRRAETGEPAMHDHEVPVGNNCPRFVSKKVRESFDEVEQSLTARFDMRAVLDVVGRPISFSCLVVPLVEQCVESKASSTSALFCSCTVLLIAIPSSLRHYWYNVDWTALEVSTLCAG
jgi:hypothetical protein